jgi:hypothetical protein
MVAITWSAHTAKSVSSPDKHGMPPLRSISSRKNTDIGSVPMSCPGAHEDLVVVAERRKCRLRRRINENLQELSETDREASTLRMPEPDGRRLFALSGFR